MTAFTLNVTADRTVQLSSNLPERMLTPCEGKGIYTVVRRRVTGGSSTPSTLKRPSLVIRERMSQQRQVRQQAGTVEANAVRLDVEKAEQVVEALNADLAATSVLYHQLRKHRWCVAGPQSRELQHFLADAAEDAERHADALARRIGAVGGVPLSDPAAFERHSPIPFEGENVYDARTSLENDLEAYGDLIESVSSHLELVESLGDHATGHLLREQLVELEARADAIDAFLGHDSLTLW
jgi:DNA-binding ferritin-like protein